MRRWLAELTRWLIEIYVNQMLIYVMIDNGPDLEPDEVFAGYCTSVLMVEEWAGYSTGLKAKEGKLYRYWLVIREPGGTFIMTERVEWLNLKWSKERRRWEVTKTKGKAAPQRRESQVRRILNRG